MAGPKFTVIQGGAQSQDLSKPEVVDALEILGIEFDFSDRSEDNVMTITVLIAALTAAIENQDYVSAVCVMRDESQDVDGDQDYSYAYFNTTDNLVQVMGTIELMKLRLQEVLLENLDPTES